MAALIGRGLGSSVARSDARDAKSSGEAEPDIHAAIERLRAARGDYPQGHSADSAGRLMVRVRAADLDAALVGIRNYELTMKVISESDEGSTLNCDPLPNWALCPSTHCERREECCSPSDCTIKARGAIAKALPEQPRDQQVVRERSRETIKSEPDQ